MKNAQFLKNFLFYVKLLWPQQIMFQGSISLRSWSALQTMGSTNMPGWPRSHLEATCRVALDILTQFSNFKSELFMPKVPEALNVFGFRRLRDDFITVITCELLKTFILFLTKLGTKVYYDAKIC